MRQPGKFAPVSGAPSSLIGVASGYFMLSAVLLTAFTLIPLVFSPELRDRYTPPQLVASVALSLAWAAAMLWTAILLGRGSRRGGYYALGFTLLSFLSSPSGTTLAFTVLSFIVLASIWRDLK